MPERGDFEVVREGLENISTGAWGARAHAANYDVAAWVETVREGLPPMGMTSISEKPVRAVDANRYHAALRALLTHIEAIKRERDELLRQKSEDYRRFSLAESGETTSETRWRFPRLQ